MTWTAINALVTCVVTDSSISSTIDFRVQGLETLNQNILRDVTLAYAPAYSLFQATTPSWSSSIISFDDQ